MSLQRLCLSSDFVFCITIVRAQFLLSWQKKSQNHMMNLTILILWVLNMLIVKIDYYIGWWNIMSHFILKDIGTIQLL